MQPLQFQNKSWKASNSFNKTWSCKRFNPFIAISISSVRPLIWYLTLLFYENLLRITSISQRSQCFHASTFKLCLLQIDAGPRNTRNIRLSAMFFWQGFVYFRSTQLSVAHVPSHYFEKALTGVLMTAMAQRDENNSPTNSCQAQTWKSSTGSSASVHSVKMLKKAPCWTFVKFLVMKTL